MKYRLGLDLGTNSIGWAMIQLDPEGAPKKILKAGARIFSDGRDPKDKTSLATARRIARSARRRRDRYLKRRARLLKVLIKLGLMPADESRRLTLRTLNPYFLRARAATDAVSPYELGRALFHLNQRRGFHSNRRVLNGDEQKLIGPKIEETRAALGSRTAGQYLWTRLQEGQSTRCRHELDLYFDRAMLKAEFEIIRSRQGATQQLDDDAWNLLQSVIFFQRPLKPIEAAPCSLDPSSGSRAPTALPSFQEFRILHELSNLRLIGPDRRERALTTEEHSRAFAILNRKKELPFEKLRKELALSDDVEFNLESETRTKLKGNATAEFFASKNRLGKSWSQLSLEMQDQLVGWVLMEPRPSLPLDLLSLTPEHRQCIENISDEQLPSGHCRFSMTTLRRLLPLMRNGQRFEKAKLEGGFEEARPQSSSYLEYYGKVLPEAVVPLRQGSRMAGSADEKKHGRIPNPTVHIGLNQLRKIVNRLTEVYGKPEEIHLEIVRDLKMTREQQSLLRRRQAEDKKRNDRYREMLSGMGLPDSYDNRMRLRLWEELSPDVNDRHCPYTGQRISATQLFSPAIHIEHILPFSETLDDGIANKTLSTLQANKEKGNRSPFEAWGHNSTAYMKILERASTLPKNKRWRFDPDAMSKFREGDRWLARQLTDTAYLARVARKFLSSLVTENKVRVLPGRLTALLRHHWGLNSVLSPENVKDRSLDHRHHAVDAIVVALTDASLLNAISKMSSRGTIGRLGNIPTPWPNLREEANRIVQDIITSHRVNHNPQGRLFDETSYGATPLGGHEFREGYNLVARKPLIALTENQVEQVRDERLRTSLQAAVDASKDEDLKGVLANWGLKEGIKTLRVLKKDASAIPVQGKMLIPDHLVCIQIWEMPPAKGENRGVLHKDLVGVQGHEILKMKNAKSGSQAWRPHPAAKLLMKIHKGDTVVFESKKTGRKEIAKVFSLKPSQNLIACRRVNEIKGTPFFLTLGTMKAENLRVVRIDEIGRIQDGGPIL